MRYPQPRRRARLRWTRLASFKPVQTRLNKLYRSITKKVLCAQINIRNLHTYYTQKCNNVLSIKQILKMSIWKSLVLLNHIESQRLSQLTSIISLRKLGNKMIATCFIFFLISMTSSQSKWLNCNSHKLFVLYLFLNKNNHQSPRTDWSLNLFPSNLPSI